MLYFIACVLVVAFLAGIGFLAYGVVLLIGESKKPEASGSAPQKHTLRIPFIGFEFDSTRLSLLFIVLGVLLLIATVPRIPALLTSKWEGNQAIVTNARHKLDKLLPAAERSRWNVSLSSCLILPEEHARIGHFLQGLGFTSVRTRSHRFDKRNDRLAGTDTVFYYSSTNAEIADTLARMLSAELGRQFVPSRGDGIGVPPARAQAMLVVHRIGEDCRSEA